MLCQVAVNHKMLFIHQKASLETRKAAWAYIFVRCHVDNFDDVKCKPPFIKLKLQQEVYEFERSDCFFFCISHPGYADPLLL